MASKLIMFEDGTLVEVEVEAGASRPIAGGAAEQIATETIDAIGPMLLKVSRPLVAAWNELNRDMHVDGAEVELGLSFESEGNVFLAKATASASITVKLSLKSKKTHE